MTKHFDLEYEDNVITDVQPTEGGYEIGMSGIWFHIPRTVEPHVGDTARLYGKGLGYVVRGVDINGQEVFYRTPTEQEEENQRQLKQMEANNKRRFEENREKYDADYTSLPPEFQRRIDRFRRNNPNFRWKHEGYEMSVCVDAVKIARTLKTTDAIEEFHDADWEVQQEKVPGLFDGHSGNSFGAACFLARLYLEHPDLVDTAHGALCPLVGCEEYGCFAAYQDNDVS